MKRLDSSPLMYIFNEHQLEKVLSSKSTSVTHIYCTLKYEGLKPALINKLKNSTLTSISFSDAHTLYPNDGGDKNYCLPVQAPPSREISEA